MQQEFFGGEAGYLKQADVKEAWQHLQGRGAREGRRKGADGEPRRGEGCEVGVQGRCGCRERECGEHMGP